MVNKRKQTPPKRWVNINTIRKRREALNQIYRYHRHHEKPKQINELHDLATEAQLRYESGGIQWPFDIEDDQLETGISRAHRENFHMNVDNMQSKPGWWNPSPGNPRSNNRFFEDKKYWIDYNKAIQNDFGKHLHFRRNAADFERFDNHVLRKFRW